ncbi:MAG TPA: LamG-like jellyroll fold domain-containing protein [Solirubrobacteraceae bacterium]|nr:LamG-like jellyroll fold domain-containing protein [Solirubrobacteraceae bacterium]
MGGANDLLGRESTRRPTKHGSAFPRDSSFMAVVARSPTPTLRRAVTCLLGALLLIGSHATPAGATAPYAGQRPPLTTPWTSAVSSTDPLPEYPRPQLERADWLSLNGQWQYGAGHAGEAPPFGQDLPETVLVPFPIESALSGIGREDAWGWYRRTFEVPASWSGQHVMLNFGAVAWQATVYVNGSLVGTHTGAYDSFSLDITSFLRPGQSNELVVGFYDPIGGAGEPVGKQTPGPPHGIYHTASSGIWQTVWLEPVSADHITALDPVSDPSRDQLTVSASTSTSEPAMLIVQVLAGNRVVASATGAAQSPLSLHVPHARLWSPTSPYLYGLRVRLLDGSSTVDDVESYFGMRSITLGRVRGRTRILLNGRFVFETGALDQGYWPDGLYTPPTDAALRFDISAAKRLGYNMLREHQKVQPDRWYYWADRLGILVWQDMPAMQLPSGSSPSPPAQAEFRAELHAIVLQHRADPSLVGWVPFNEGWDQFDPGGVTSEIKSLDSSALVDSDSGSANCCHAVQPANSDVNDTHLYFGPFAVAPTRQASLIGEYGGVLPFPPAGHRWPGVLTSLGSPVLAWGVRPVTLFLRAQYQELEQEMRVRGLSGAVFTELAGYEDELGILTYDRRAYTMPVGVIRGLNRALVAASQTRSGLKPQVAAVPPGATGHWRLDEGRGMTAHDAAAGHDLRLIAGAGWSRSPFGAALSLSRAGQAAVAAGALVNTRRSFTVSAWLSPRHAGESGTALSEAGPDGSSFSLGIDTAPQGTQSLNGLPGARSVPDATWWTFAVPASARCSAEKCGVRANMRYDDGRFAPRPGSWHQVTGVYDRATQTIALYVDGIPEDVEHVFGIPVARGQFTVGSGNLVYRTDTFIGAISEVRAYARALSPAEVWELYRAERSRR